MLVCGMSLLCVDETNVVIPFHTPRVPVEESLPTGWLMVVG
jgi:hypothetical protein